MLKQHRSRFRGRTTPVQFFWGTFDLVVTRFSGRRLTPPSDAGLIRRFSEDAEEICAGWWAGDERVPYPAFYAYPAPKPDGIERATIAPSGAAWNEAAGLFLLPYDEVRSLPDPAGAVVEFLGSTYAAAADLMEWDRSLVDVPSPRALAATEAHK